MQLELKLLFDQNLTFRLAYTVRDLFPHSVHVRELGFATSSDEEIWSFAKQNGFAIISKDSDFHQMSFLYGTPPKVVWLRCGNCSTAELEQVIRGHADEIQLFMQSSESALLVINN